MSSFADSLSDRTSSNQRLSDEQFQILEVNTLSPHELNNQIKSLPSKQLFTSIAIQTDFSETMGQDQIKRYEVGEQKQCSCCQQLSIDIRNLTRQKLELQTEIQYLRESLKQYEQIERISQKRSINISQMKNTDSTIHSLKQIIVYYEEEEKRIINSVKTLMGYKQMKSQQKRSLKEIIEATLAELLANWRQSMQDLQEVQRIVSKHSQFQCASLQKYNHFLTLRKINNIKDRVYLLIK